MIRPPEWTSTIGARNVTYSNVNIFWPMKTQPISNLFRIKKASLYCLVRGGSTDLWMGHLTEGGDAVEVQTVFSPVGLFLIFQHLLQVAVKVPKGPEDPEKRVVRFRTLCNTASYVFCLSGGASVKSVAGPQSVMRISYHCWVSPATLIVHARPALSIRITGMAILQVTSRINRESTRSHW